MEWESLNKDQMTWHVLKAHFVEAYEAQLHSVLGTVAQHGYHEVANTTKDQSFNKSKGNQ